MPPREVEANRIHNSVLAAIAKANFSISGKGLIDPIETGSPIDRCHWLGVTQIHDPELAQRIATAVISKVHTRNGKVECCLLFRRKIEIGEEKGLRINAVPHLSIPIQRVGFNGDSLFA